MLIVRDVTDGDSVGGIAPTSQLRIRDASCSGG